jgi:RNA polymerase sigma-70 factor, ECF subfamily
MAQADDARISDETLIGRTAAGDLTAFDRLVRRHQAAVYRFARAATPREGEPEEILRETFLAARRVAARYRDETSARPWLLALARQAIDRRYPRRDRDADATPLRELARAAGWDLAGVLDAGSAEPPTRHSVGAALEELAPGDREILTLCDREHLTVGEAARVAGLPEAAVRTRLHRARLRLLALPTLAATAVEHERLIAGLHCGEVLAELTEHLEGRLSRVQSLQMEEHLSGCDGCRRLGDEILGVVHALREMPEEPLAHEVEERLQAQLRATGT